ncbi:MAG: hypothetical protein LBH85_03735, partial [Treponema sp.]|nr:hypothetical protein [Treponema sp.]
EGVLYEFAAGCLLTGKCVFTACRRGVVLRKRRMPPPPPLVAQAQTAPRMSIVPAKFWGRNGNDDAIGESIFLSFYVLYPSSPVAIQKKFLLN